jgi:D-cysteine desulfhydrase family pyridoxal phosphate-dependent enzyme
MTVADRIAALPRERLVTLPTPLDHAPRLGRELGCELLIKRDDLTGIGLGGNKLRKLEFILGQAKADRVDTLLTTGGLQSNHARLTAAVAARAGMNCELHLKGEPTTSRISNLLLDALFGAKIEICGAVDYADIDRRMNARADELARTGRKALVIPLGGATALGTVGYVLAFREIFDQLGASQSGPLTIVVAGGTGSTAAGLLLGASIWAQDTRVIVVSASWSREVLTGEIRRCAADAALLLGVAEPRLDHVQVEDGYVGPGYARPSEQGCAAVRRVARAEGIVLDTTYTGKAMSGFIALASPGQRGKIVFVHTGGTPELFTRDARELGV